MADGKKVISMPNAQGEADPDSVQTTFKFNRQTLAIIDQLKKEFGASSKAEVIRKALALLELARQARENGGTIAVVDTDGTHHKILGI
jgi:hypothetical protein